MTYIPRIIQKHIESVLFKGKIVILYGPRQVGKTTMVKKIIESIPEAAYYLCDNPSIKAGLEHKNAVELQQFILGKKIVVFDEAQQVSNIGVSLKILHDTYPDVQIIATGSSSFDLANKVKEPLTGRALEYTLFPLSFTEILSTLGPIETHQLLPVMLNFGMYPNVLFPTTDRKEILTTIASQYLYKDLLKYEGIRKPYILEKLLKVLAASIGSEISYFEIANTIDVNKKTVENYMQLLEQAFIIYKVPPYYKNIRSQVTKKHKIYFYDLGIRNAILDAFSDIEHRVDIGHIWENFVITERKKKLGNNRDILGRQYFFRTYNGQEIDLIEEIEGPKVEAFEIKYSAKNKYSSPAIWKKEYPSIPITIITKENFSHFLK